MSDELWAALEDMRGSVPRERFVRDCLVMAAEGLAAYDAEYQRNRPKDMPLLPEQIREFRRGTGNEPTGSGPFGF